MLFQLIQPVYAQCDPGNNNGVNLGDCLILNQQGDTVAAKYDTFADVVNLIVGNAFVLGGFILFFMLFFAGFKFISGGSKGKDEARTIITTALIGMLIMFVAYWIVRIVEFVIGTPILL